MQHVPNKMGKRKDIKKYGYETKQIKIKVKTTGAVECNKIEGTCIVKKIMINHYI